MSLSSFISNLFFSVGGRSPFSSWSPWLISYIQVTTLGQPLEVLKTQMAANRSQTMWQACKTVWSRGGAAGYYQGLIPWVRVQHSEALQVDVKVLGVDRSLHERCCPDLHGFRGRNGFPRCWHQPCICRLVGWHDWWRCAGLCNYGYLEFFVRDAWF